MTCDDICVHVPTPHSEWDDAYGGHLELWDRNLTQCAQRILPAFNRFVAFRSTDFSYHGHPMPMVLPTGRLRRSIAMYYYQAQRPANECYNGVCHRYHTTTWQRSHGVCQAKEAYQ